VPCHTSVKTEWRAFYGDLYTGRFLTEADTRDEAIRLAEIRIEQLQACGMKSAEWDACAARVRSVLEKKHPELKGADLEAQIKAVVPIQLAAEEQSRRALKTAPVDYELSQNPHRPGPERSSPEIEGPEL
jgi:hypothetical protein